MPEFLEKQKRYEKRAERLIMLIYSVYCIAITYISTQKGVGFGVFFVLLGGLAIMWSLYLTDSKTYFFRARVFTVVANLGVVLYSVALDDYMEWPVRLLSISVLVGLYEIPSLVEINSLCALILFLYQCVHFGMIGNTPEEIVQGLLRFGMVFFGEIAIYSLVRNQRISRQEQQKTIEDLQAAEQSRDDFLTNVSHELRTPISTICGMCEIVLKDSLSERQRENVNTIQTAGRNLHSVVSDILDFSELQAGEMDLVEESYHLTSMLNDVVQLSMARRNKKKIELLLDVDATLPCTLIGDEQKIRRVIMNLMDNAIKFTTEGCVILEVGYRQEAYGINLIVSVKDTGVGIREQGLEKMFDGFSKVDRSRNRKETGIGLGLAISSAIVEAMGGFIKVSSEYGHGTEISFTIPQKVADHTPITRVEDPARIKAAIYFNVDRYALNCVRDAYGSVFSHLIAQLGLDCRICRTFLDFKNRAERESFSHVFISYSEYLDNPEYFDELALHTKLTIVMERPDDRYVENDNLICLYKPFYVIPFVNVLNDHHIASGGHRRNRSTNKFIAPKAKVMIVDDNEMNIRVAAGLLKPYQMQVVCVSSGMEAIDTIRTQDYDFIFMDHMMPGMDGIETLEAIRHMPGKYYREVPIIALTANAVSGMREMFLSKGFADYIAKPIEISVLDRVLRRNLPADKLVEVVPNSSLKDSVSDRKSEEVIDQIVTMKRPDEGTLPKNEQQVRMIGDLNVEQGIAFCGNWETLLEILKLQAQDHETIEHVEQFRAERDWKNYSILVHGIKSSMKTIGAQRLSDMAGELEAAGKREDKALIAKKHGAFRAEYDRVQAMIAAYVCGDEAE